MKKIGYLGPEGTFTEDAVLRYLENKNYLLVPCMNIPSVIKGIKEGDLEEGVVPLENSLEGSVNITLDLLAQECGLKIKGEVVLPIVHNLIGWEGTFINEITKIISHPQALAQCRDYIQRNLARAEILEVSSTSEAVGMVAAGKRSWAAVGTKKAAELNNLTILAPEIQDRKDNLTRFIVVAKEDAPYSPDSKTSIIVSITDRPGGLYQILKEFALRNINLTKIESRPAKKNLGDYIFLIDLLGHRKEPVVKECLDIIEAQAASFKILGSYPVDKSFKVKSDRSAQQDISLQELREDIDIIDYQIVDLLAKRRELVNRIGLLKKGGEIRDTERERQILQRLRKNALQKNIDPELIEKIYLSLFDYFVHLQESYK